MKPRMILPMLLCLTVLVAGVPVASATYVEVDPVEVYGDLETPYVLVGAMEGDYVAPFATVYGDSYGAGCGFQSCSQLHFYPAADGKLSPEGAFAVLGEGIADVMVYASDDWQQDEDGGWYMTYAGGHNGNYLEHDSIDCTGACLVNDLPAFDPDRYECTVASAMMFHEDIGVDLHGWASSWAYTTFGDCPWEETTSLDESDLEDHLEMIPGLDGQTPLPGLPSSEPTCRYLDGRYDHARETAEEIAFMTVDAHWGPVGPDYLMGQTPTLSVKC